MIKKHGLTLATAMAIAGFVSGCSSTDNSSPNKGNMVMALKASGTVSAGTTTTGLVAADQSEGPTAATITISGASARTPDGTWVPVQGSFPKDVDLIALAASGKTVTLPADILPEGHYDAIQIIITAANLTLYDGTKVAITPPGTGWEVVIPVSFDVVAGQQTIVNLNLRCDLSFDFLNGEFEFHPEIEVDGVEHHDD